MNRRRFIRNVAAGTAFAGMGLLSKELFAANDLVTITVFHTNDLHCHIEPFADTNENYNGKGGLARIASILKKHRNENPNTLLFDAGDMFQGTPYFNYFEGDLMLKVMSTAGYDAGTIGNHEFDNGMEGLLNALPNASFPIINSNYDFSETILSGKFQRYKIFNRSGIKIGVYGLGIELKGLVTAKNYGNIIYNDPLQIALEMEKFLKTEQNCDLVICLSHLGHRYSDNKVSDLFLAGETYMTDLFIGGHTHTYLDEPVIQKNKAGEPVIINQAWWGGMMMGKIDFVFEPSKKTRKAIFANFVNG